MCWNLLQAPVAVCENGHGTCPDCRTKIPLCSVCKKSFQNMWVRPLDDILRILPRRCKFNVCPEFVTAKDDHEELCGYRPTACKTCDWKGCVKDIIDHVQTEFEPLDILREMTTGVVLRDCSSILGVLWYPHVRNNLTANKLECFYPMLAHEQMFWLNFTTDLLREEFIFSITSVPQQKFRSLFNVTFWVVKDRRVFRISSTIYPEDLLSKNRDILFSLPFSTVQRFIERDFTLVYSLNIETINWMISKQYVYWNMIVFLNPVQINSDLLTILVTVLS